MSDWTETAKRLAAHPKWSEMMTDTAAGYGIVWRDDDGWTYRITDHVQLCHEDFPVLTDWATVGALLGMLSEEGPWRLRYLGAGFRWCAEMDEFGARGGVEGRSPGEAVATALLEVWDG